MTRLTKTTKGTYADFSLNLHHSSLCSMNCFVTTTKTTMLDIRFFSNYSNFISGCWIFIVLLVHMGQQKAHGFKWQGRREQQQEQERPQFEMILQAKMCRKSLCFMPKIVIFLVCRSLSLFLSLSLLFFLFSVVWDFDCICRMRAWKLVFGCEIDLCKTITETAAHSVWIYYRQQHNNKMRLDKFIWFKFYRYIGVFFTQEPTYAFLMLHTKLFMWSKQNTMHSHSQSVNEQPRLIWRDSCDCLLTKQ